MATHISQSCSHNTADRRMPAVAGQFYSASADTLADDVDGFLKSAGVSPATDVRAIIVPHAGYVFSGAMAAKAYMRINPVQRYKRVFLLGPSHKAAFDGASVNSQFGAYATPLGDVSVDLDVCETLLRADSVFCCLPKAHDGEHCLEVQLPFLQRRLDKVPPIVPIIIGTQDVNKLERVAKALQPYFTADNLFVISSDFSHYPRYTDALDVDGITGRAIGKASLTEFIAALNDNASRHISNLYTSACGQSPIAVLLMMMGNGGALTMEHLGYCNSGDSPYGDHDGVVGYHAFAVTGGKTKDNTTENDTSFSLTADEKRTLLSIARRTIENELNGSGLQPCDTTQLDDALKARCGAFVTLTSGGRLRGCIGNLVGHRPLYATVMAMAKSAAFEDPRFYPVRKDELDGIKIEISVLSPLRRISSIDEFQLGRHGLFIVKGASSDTFLPQVAGETGWTKEEFFGHCSRDKAGLGWDGWRDAELYVYEAEVFGEDDLK